MIVANVPECYHVLGIIHHKWRAVPGQFDDPGFVETVFLPEVLRH